ncbi:MAG: MFS transporter [Erysipelotrichaceae bacterium]|nr:MFS transporter [Erysipelotrichaceae bacterium]
MKKKKHVWVVVACMGLAGASIGVMLNTPGVFYTPVCEDLGFLRGDFSFHMTLLSLGLATMSLFAPFFLKRFRYHTILLVSVIVCAGCTALMGCTDSLPVFYILGTLRGISCCFFNMPLVIIINNWFKSKAGTATGVVYSTCGIVGSILSPVLSAVIESLGWRTGYFAAAGFTVLLCLPSLLVPFCLSPEEEGLQPYYDENEKVSQKVQTTKTGCTGGIVAFLAFALMISFMANVAQHFPGFADSLGYSAAIGAMLVSAAMIGNIVFKLVIGVLIDKLGTVVSALIMISFCIAGLGVLVMAPSVVVMYAASFLFGAVYSISSVGTAHLTRTFFGEEGYMKYYPKVAFAVNFGGAVSLSLVGYIYDFTHSYASALYLGIVMMTLGFVFLFTSRKGKKVC